MHQHHSHITRILFTQSGELLDYNSYYPFGMLMSGLVYNTGGNKFQASNPKYQTSNKFNPESFRDKKSNTRLAESMQ